MVEFNINPTDPTGEYDLVIDGRHFADLNSTTLTQLRAKAKSGKSAAVEEDQWSRGPGGPASGVSGGVGGGGGGGGRGGGRRHAEPEREEFEAEASPMPVQSLSAFMGTTVTTTTTTAGSKSAAASAKAGAGGGDAGAAWDPFGGSGAADLNDFGADFTPSFCLLLKVGYCAKATIGNNSNDNNNILFILYHFKKAGSNLILPAIYCLFRMQLQ